MKTLRAALFSLFITVSLPLFTMAHPGHEGDEGGHGFTIIHYFTRPVHMVITLPAVVFLCWYGVRYFRRKAGKL